MKSTQVTNMVNKNIRYARVVKFHNPDGTQQRFSFFSIPGKKPFTQR